MAIPKIIYQTYKTAKLPFTIRRQIARMKKLNPQYGYEFYDDKRVEDFIAKEFDKEILSIYKRINIGAAKADFFRYAILYKKGGVYVDIDSTIVKNLDGMIRPDDHAVITRERNPYYVQWALIYEAGHPFLARTIDKMLNNLRSNKYPYDVHKMTGPTVYTEAIDECLSENKEIQYRLFGVDYNGYLQFKFPFHKLIYLNKKHWRKDKRPILKS